MFTRKDYLDGKTDHEGYYSQFLTPELPSYVVDAIGEERLRKSTDRSFNDISLTRWDAVALSALRRVPNAKWYEAGDWPSLGGGVCLVKLAARRWLETHKQ